MVPYPILFSAHFYFSLHFYYPIVLLHMFSSIRATFQSILIFHINIFFQPPLDSEPPDSSGLDYTSQIDIPRVNLRFTSIHESSIKYLIELIYCQDTTRKRQRKKPIAWRTVWKFAWCFNIPSRSELQSLIYYVGALLSIIDSTTHNIHCLHGGMVIISFCYFYFEFVIWTGKVI